MGEAFRGYLAQHQLDEYRGSPLALSDENMHPSVLGHRIASRALYQYLCERHFAAELSSCDLTPWETGGGPSSQPAVGP